MTEFQTNPATSRPPVTAPATAPRGTIGADFETFLRMLTAQIRNQDPMNPMQSTEFATQLATFSGVEQQVQTNTLLTDLVQARGATGLQSAAQWVGMQVRADMPLRFEGAPLSVHVGDGAEDQDRFLVVSEPGGTEIQRLAIPPGQDRVTWAGVGAAGAPLADGLYRFTVESIGPDGAPETAPAQGYDRVREAQVEGGDLWLLMDSGALVPATRVAAVRAAQ